jgi:hypothetical protein
MDEANAAVTAVLPTPVSVPVMKYDFIKNCGGRYLIIHLTRGVFLNM